jgi:hypothetical protein
MPLINNDRLSHPIVRFGKRLGITAAALAILSAVLLGLTLIFLR